MVRVVFLILGGLLVIFLFVVVPRFFTGIITSSRFHFHDPNDGETPESFGMAFAPVEFHASDGVRLEGWYVPAGSVARGTIIYGHGQNRTRVEMLPMAQFAHSLGYNGLLFDFRHQGASGGELSTIGYWERLDVEAAARYALAREGAARPVIGWGVSMGAAAMLMAAADDHDITAVISDSTFLSFDDVVKHHWKLVGHFFKPLGLLPAFPIADEIIDWAAWRGHFHPSDFDLRTAVERINPRPILFVAVEGDQRMPPDIARALYALSTSPQKALVVLPGTRHGEGFNSGRQPYEQAVARFLAEVSKAPAAVAGAGNEKSRPESGRAGN